MSEITKTQAQLSDELDAALLAAVLKEKGKDEPSAAIFNAANNRLKHLGIDKVPQAGDDADQLAKECGLDDDSILAFPSTISDEPDAATA